MQERLLSLDSKLSALDSGQKDLRESLKYVASQSEMRQIVDSLSQNQQESLRQYQQEFFLHREQQQLKQQQQLAMLQQQQHLLERQQQQLALQQGLLERIALQQESLILPARNQASAPPLSVEEDEFHVNLPDENGSNMIN
jgi:hypothetical protein